MSSSRQRLFVVNDPHALRICPELAVEIGFMESVVLMQFEFLISISRYERAGKKWIRYTVQELRDEYFSWVHKSTVWRAIKSLEDQRLIFMGNFNRLSFDKTLWFAIDMKNVAKLTSVRVVDDYVEPVLQDETPSLLQPETAQVSDPESHGRKTRPLQDETSSSKSRPPVADREIDDRDLQHGSEQNATTIGTDLRKDLLPPEGEAAAPPVESKVNAATILADVLQAGTKYPKNFKGHLGHEVHNLLKESFPPDVVRAAAQRCIDKSLNPSTMPSLVVEIQNGKGKSNGNHQPFDPSNQDYADTVVR